MTDTGYRTAGTPAQSWRFREIGAGNRTSVVLLHGFPDTPQSWHSIADHLADADHHVIIPYLRGYHPDTIVPGRRYGSRELGDDVTGLLDELDISRAVLVGHDWGAGAAYETAKIAPDRVRGLVPIAVPHPGAIRPSPTLIWEVRHFWRLKLPGAAARAARDHFAYIETLYERWAPRWRGPERDAAVSRAKAAFNDPQVMEAARDYYRDISLVPDPTARFRVSCPGLLVAGSDDFLPDAHRRSLAFFDGPADLWMVDGAGHWPHREREADFSRRLTAFLSDLDD